MQIKKWWELHGYRFVLITLLLLVFVALVFNLFTPERIKQQNYLKWVKFRNFVYSVQPYDKKGEVPCKKKVDNPIYAAQLEEYNLKSTTSAEYIKILNDCYSKNNIKGNDKWDLLLQDSLCGSKLKPDLKITIDAFCPSIVKKEQWVTMFGKKVYLKSSVDLR